MDVNVLDRVPNERPDGLIEAYREAKALGLQDQRYRIDTYSRVILAAWATIIVSWWLYSVVSILKLNKTSYGLSDPVLIALLSTTTLNVLGLIAIVLYGHFLPNHKPKDI